MLVWDWEVYRQRELPPLRTEGFPASGQVMLEGWSELRLETCSLPRTLEDLFTVCSL